MMEQFDHVCFEGVEPPVRPARFVARARCTPNCPGTALGTEPPCEDRQASAFVSWLLGQAGLDASAYRVAPMQRRLAACLRSLRVSSAEEAQRLLTQKPQLLPEALDSFLIGVSSFFRDQHVFEFLEHTLLPELLQTRRSLKVLSAGCSSGQELYSIAMILDKLGRLHDAVLAGVDCRGSAIDEARIGRFERNALGELAPADLERYFLAAGSKLEVLPWLRSRIRWQLGDLLALGEDTCWDVVLFRNVSIYLQHEKTYPLWARLAASLTPGGLLITGKSERPPAPLPLTRIKGCVYRKSES